VISVLCELYRWAQYLAEIASAVVAARALRRRRKSDAELARTVLDPGSETR
jgi:hypothetical protein